MVLLQRCILWFFWYSNCFNNRWVQIFQCRSADCFQFGLPLWSRKMWTCYWYGNGGDQREISSTSQYSTSEGTRKVGWYNIDFFMKSVNKNTCNNQISRICGVFGKEIILTKSTTFDLRDNLHDDHKHYWHFKLTVLSLSSLKGIWKTYLNLFLKKSV